MKNNLTMLLISVGVFAATWWQRPVWLNENSAYGRYYVAVLLAISSLTAVTAMVQLIRGLIPRPAPVENTGAPRTALPRQHYRLQFPAPPRPRFVQRTTKHPSASTFVCEVVDVSESGVSLDCEGVYAQGQAVSGEIVFPSGRTASVDGFVIRRAHRRTCLNFHAPIDASLLMDEQRERIVADKGGGPHPPAIRPFPDNRLGDLPSHTTKGIYRLKRP